MINTNREIEDIKNTLYIFAESIIDLHSHLKIQHSLKNSVSDSMLQTVCQNHAFNLWVNIDEMIQNRINEKHIF